MIKFRIAEDTRKLIGKRVEVTQISKRNHNCKQNNFPERLAKICDWLYLVLQLNFCL